MNLNQKISFIHDTELLIISDDIFGQYNIVVMRDDLCTRNVAVTEKIIQKNGFIESLQEQDY